MVADEQGMLVKGDANGIVNLVPLGVLGAAQEVFGLPSPLAAVGKRAVALHPGVRGALSHESCVAGALVASKLRAEFLEPHFLRAV